MSISGSEDGSVSNSENHCEFEGDQQVVLKKDDQVEMMMINPFHGSNSFSATSTNTTTSTKKKRSLPGNPDPNAEVIALSPKMLMAKNRFVCEICNKGFQRDQNLQLHRRGHNLPWKLKLRASNELNRKKVYVCPEPSCVHHNPGRALGDLTGIKKHFSRKHGEKKWKCDKCSKKYAVQSDWKAHSKTCGSREYKCDCGTIFSRRDSFITHRAFCDALVSEENKNRASQHDHGEQVSHMIEEPRLNIESSQLQSHDLLMSQLIPLMSSSTNQNPSKSGKLSIFPSRTNNSISNNVSSSSAVTATKNMFEAKLGLDQLISSPRSSLLYSATALLQKAAQMGAAVSTSASNATSTSIMAPSSFGSHGLLMSQNNQPIEGTMSDHHFFDMNMGSGAFNGLFGSQDDQKYNDIKFLKDVKNLSNNVCSSSTNDDHHEGFLHCVNPNGGSMTLDLLGNEGVSYHGSESFRDGGF